MDTNPQNGLNENENQNDLAQWQKDLIDKRLTKYRANPQNTVDWDQIVQELDNEDT
jgi:hypothetical protein